MDNKSEWLASLKVGDEVAVRLRIGGHLVEKIARTTQTIIYVGNKAYNRKDGLERPYRRFGTSIVPVTDDMREMHNRTRLVERVSYPGRALVESLTTDQLRRIAAILDEKKQPNGQ